MVIATFNKLNDVSYKQIQEKAIHQRSQIACLQSGSNCLVTQVLDTYISNISKQSGH